MNEMSGIKRPECFVAMWFGADSDSEAEMNQLYELVIKPAIEQQELLPYHVGKDLKADKLDEAILEAIDRATLVVVDLTHDPKTGLRGSVVFEAGYAYKTKPVIWMCRDDLADSAPFDIRQFRQIRWNRNKLVEARDQLAKVIGERIDARQVHKADHEISRMNEWGGQESRYSLVCPWGNSAQVYALKRASASEGEVPHFLCTNCFHRKEKVIPNAAKGDRATQGNSRMSLVCPACKAAVYTDRGYLDPPQYAEEYKNGSQG